MGKRKKGLGKYNRMRHWTSPNKSVVSEYGARIHSMVRGEVAPLTQGLDQLIQNKNTQVPVVAVRLLGEIWKSDFQQGLDVYHYVKMWHPIWKAVKLFTCGAKNIWVQEREDCWRYSITYRGRTQAMQAFERNRITWIKKLEYPG